MLQDSSPLPRRNCGKFVQKRTVLKHVMYSLSSQVLRHVSPEESNSVLNKQPPDIDAEHVSIVEPHPTTDAEHVTTDKPGIALPKELPEEKQTTRLPDTTPGRNNAPHFNREQRERKMTPVQSYPLRQPCRYTTTGPSPPQPSPAHPRR